MAIKNTLEYLLLSEFLNPQTLPKIEKEYGKFRRAFECEISNFTVNFWDCLKQIKEIRALAETDPKKKRSLCVEIYGGIYDTNEIANEIFKALPSLKDDEFRQSSLTQAASYYLKFSGELNIKDDNGEIRLKNLINKDFINSQTSNLIPLCGEDSGFGIQDSIRDFFLSTAPWACARFTNLDELKYENFNAIQAEIADRIKQYQKDERSLQELIKLICTMIKSSINSPLITDRMRVAVSLKKGEDAHGSPMLNSFFIDDINLALAKGTEDKNLNLIFSEIGEDELKRFRIDLREDKNLAFALSCLGRENYPSGAFASKYALIFSQQIAVNNILKLFKEKKGGIYSINGPPDTGKTTLLKEVIVAVVVERAKILANLNESEIFAKGVKGAKTLAQDEKTSEYPDFYPLNDALKGFEIVIASCNNKAVQNISQEIPKMSDIDEKYAIKLDYFAFEATRALSGNNKLKGGEISQISKPAWGLFCATMGNSGNIKKFKRNCLERFWLSKNHPEYGELKSKNLINANKNEDEYLNGLISRLEWSDEAANFENAKEEFNQALQRVNELEKENFKDFEKGIEALKFAPDGQNLEQLRENLTQIENEIQNLQNQKSQLLSHPQPPELINLTPLNPPPAAPKFYFIQKLFKTAAFKDYEAQKSQIKSQNEKIQAQNLKIREINDERLKSHEEDIKETNKFNEDVKRKNEGIENKIRSLDTDASELSKQIKKAEEYEKSLCDLSAHINLRDRVAREKSSPFMMRNGVKTELAEARVEVFIKALNLHKAAISSQKYKFAANLKAFSELWRYQKRSQAREILKSLFFVVPAISSTFASFGRFFENFERDDIGLLLIDEAGQANAAAAVGALYRSKTAAIVGDPLQLEPVVTLPEILNLTLLKHADALEKFNVATTSLQMLADKTQPMGSYIGEGDNKIWVGSPLVVHRRCDEPMFSISNEIAYGGAMVRGVNKNRNSLGEFGVKSEWIDVATQNEWKGNCSLKELKKANEIYLKLTDLIAEFNASAMPEDKKKDVIKIITPFTDVVKESREMRKQEKINFEAATIHTMQGQEADIVIFILGGGSEGARKWAAQKPNLLNVALTRAKEYIYIIGDKDKWSGLKNFDEAARKL